MNYLKALAFAMILSVAVSAQVDTNSQHFYMFTYFINIDDQVGARIALSTDGINWTKVNNEAPIITPTIGDEHRMRDPNVYFDKTTGVFHLVWTTGWVEKKIGYATSKNLKDWGTQISIPVGEKINNCISCWAPELFYDDIKDSIMLYWSAQIGNGYGYRGYYSMTKDFKEFTAPTKYFDPGYTVIDETIFKDAGKYYLFFKDERTADDAGKQTKNIHYVTGPTPQGPWDSVSTAVTNMGCEGPTVLQIGNEYRLYFDFYIGIASTYRMVTTTDLSSTTFPWPQGEVLKTTDGNFIFSHGSISEIPRGKFLQLLYGIPDNNHYKCWTQPLQEEITVRGCNANDTFTTSVLQATPEAPSSQVAISEQPADKQTHGCGAGFGLAFFPPLVFKAWATRSRKKKNTNDTKRKGN